MVRRTRNTWRQITPTCETAGAGRPAAAAERSMALAAPPALARTHAIATGVRTNKCWVAPSGCAAMQTAAELPHLAPRGRPPHCAALGSCGARSTVMSVTLICAIDSARQS